MTGGVSGASSRKRGEEAARRRERYSRGNSAYLPDARPDAAAHFTTVSRQPNNPLLELNVYLPGQERPLRQVAFAKNPLLSLDGIHGWNCPVKFWYHHPAVPPEAGTQFLQTPDGKLHYRVIADGKTRSIGRGA